MYNGLRGRGMLEEACKPEKAKVEKALRDVFQSVAFRSSKQCQLLLSYIVEHTLARKDDLLRERVIGASVFGRAPDYDTGNDPIVRARVAEVRKRLAQYYLEYAEEAAFQISIPSGSYRAVFTSGRQVLVQQETSERPAPVRPARDVPILNPSVLEQRDRVRQNIEDTTPPRTSRRSRTVLAVAFVIVALLACGTGFRRWQEYKSRRLFEQFWAPLSNSATPPIIYIGASHTYRVSAEFLKGYRQRRQLPDIGQEFFVELTPEETLSQKDLVPVKDLIGVGDVAATAKIASALTGLGSNYDLRYGDDVSITDLRSSPDILIGGFSNPWAMQLMQGLRYTLEQGDRIVDNRDRSKMWRINVTDPNSDYVTISRLARSETGSFVLIVAGIGSSSNQAGGNLISDPLQLKKILQNAPAGWEKMNMQAVLRTKTVGEIPTSIDVEAVYFW